MQEYSCPPRIFLIFKEKKKYEFLKIKIKTIIICVLYNIEYFINKPFLKTKQNTKFINFLKTYQKN